MFGLFGEKIRDDASAPDIARIAEDILDVAVSNAKDKLVGSKIEVSAAFMHPSVHHQDVAFALMTRVQDRGLSLGLNCSKNYTFIKV